MQQRTQRALKRHNIHIVTIIHPKKDKKPFVPIDARQSMGGGIFGGGPLLEEQRKTAIKNHLLQNATSG